MGHSVRVGLHFCYGHRIPGHDGPCVHLHGHNARVEVECRGALDARGMVVDFARIKQALNEWIEAHWDHRMILQAGDPLIEILKANEEPVYVLDAPPTAENLAVRLFTVAAEAGLPVAAVRFWETDSSLAVYTGE
ncbi:MAG: 6-pyruvoyl trahydropterin synthase family protein [Planctomycetota bacterium]